MLALTAHALEEERINDGPPLRTLPEPAVQEESFWGSFKTTYSSISENLYWSQLNPLRMGRLLTRFPDQSEKFLRQVDDAAKSATWHSFEYSAREALLDSPGMLWLRERSDPFAVFFKNSIGSVAEEEINSKDVTYRSVPESWWRNLYGEGVQYGIRPFRTSPYAFVGFGVGPKSDPFALLDFRYYLHGFTRQHVELVSSVPLGRGYSIEVGTSYQVRRDGWTPGLTVKCTKEFRHFGAFFAGWESTRETLFVGATTPF